MLKVGLVVLAVVAPFIGHGLVAAQSIPSCVSQCATTAATFAGCSSYTDAECVCDNSLYTTYVQNCLDSNCGVSEQGAAARLQQAVCDGSLTTSSTTSRTSTRTTTTDDDDDETTSRTTSTGGLIPGLTTRSSTTSTTSRTSSTTRTSTTPTSTSTTRSSTTRSSSTTTQPTATSARYTGPPTQVFGSKLATTSDLGDGKMTSQPSASAESGRPPNAASARWAGQGNSGWVAALVVIGGYLF